MLPSNENGSVVGEFACKPRSEWAMPEAVARDRITIGYLSNFAKHDATQQD